MPLCKILGLKKVRKEEGQEERKKKGREGRKQGGKKKRKKESGDIEGRRERERRMSVIFRKWYYFFPMKQYAIGGQLLLKLSLELRLKKIIFYPCNFIFTTCVSLKRSQIYWFVTCKIYDLELNDTEETFQHYRLYGSLIFNISVIFETWQIEYLNIQATELTVSSRGAKSVFIRRNKFWIKW